MSHISLTHDFCCPRCGAPCFGSSTSVSGETYFCHGGWQKMGCGWFGPAEECFTVKKVTPQYADAALADTAEHKTIRQFETGATRDAEDGKLDFEGFLSPAALERYAEYMHTHRKQSDGKMRDSDNWQRGIPQVEYAKSLWRHFFTFWKLHRGGSAKDERDGHEITKEEALCGVLFNAFGYLHELLKERTK